MRKFLLIFIVVFVAVCIYVAVTRPNEVDQKRCEITYDKSYVFTKVGDKKFCKSPTGDLKEL